MVWRRLIHCRIFTGTLFAPLGFEQGVIAILLGHIIGGFLFFLAGLIGANTRRSAMETVRIGFGRQGASGFAWPRTAINRLDYRHDYYRRRRYQCDFTLGYCRLVPRNRRSHHSLARPRLQ